MAEPSGGWVKGSYLSGYFLRSQMLPPLFFNMAG